MDDEIEELYQRMDKFMRKYHPKYIDSGRSILFAFTMLSFIIFGFMVAFLTYQQDKRLYVFILPNVFNFFIIPILAMCNYNSFERYLVIIR